MIKKKLLIILLPVIMNMSVLVMKNTTHFIDKWYSFHILGLQKTASLLIAVNAQS